MIDRYKRAKGPYVAAGEVTTLEHELGDDAVEGRALVAEALLASAESTEVLGGLGDNVAEEVEVDGTSLHYKSSFRQLEYSNIHEGQARLTLGRAGRATVGVDGGTLPLNLEPVDN